MLLGSVSEGAMKRIGMSEFFDELKGAQARPLAVRTVAHRVHNVLNALVERGQTVILAGEPGNSKTRLAEEAAYLLGSRLEREVHVVVLPLPPRIPTQASSVFSGAFPEIFPADLERPNTAGETAPADPHELAERLLHHLTSLAAGREVVLIAPRVDRYSPLSELLLSEFVRATEVRVIATTHRMSGVADRLAYDPRVRVIDVGPLDLDETAVYLAELLGVDLIETTTLNRWHVTTGGNVFALTTLAHACDRAGVVHRRRGVAWVDAADDATPGELFDYLADTCTDEELETLEKVAIAGPISEAVVIRQLDAPSVTSLFQRGLLVSNTLPSGGTSLGMAHPMLVASLLEHMTVTRRLALSDEIYRLLREDHPEHAEHLVPDRLMRLVSFGLDGGHRIPTSWLTASFDTLRRGGGNPRLLERISLAILSPPDARLDVACEAAIEAQRLTRLHGDSDGTRTAVSFLRHTLEHSEQALRTEQRIMVHAVLLEEDWWAGTPTDDTVAAFDALAAEAERGSPSLVPYVRSLQAFVLVSTGALRDARIISEQYDREPRYTVNSMQATRHFILSFIVQQQGAVREAIDLAEQGRTFALLGEAPRTDIAEIDGFAMLLGFWANGNTRLGAKMIGEFSYHATSGEFIAQHSSGLNDVAAVLFAVRDGRWREAAQVGEGLVERLAHRDSYGVITVVQAALSLALSAMGEREDAIQMLHASRVIRRGFSQALGGYVRVLRLRAMHWLHADEIGDETDSVIRWAQEQELPLIELKALHIRACANAQVDPDDLARAQDLSARIDTTMAFTLASHMQRIAAAVDPLNHPEMLEARMLAELGVWLPLPTSSTLTAREREITLRAAFGYSSRLIAEQLHISARTVETHLGRVFTKLGLDNRDDLRNWFAREYEDPWEATQPPQL